MEHEVKKKVVERVFYQNFNQSLTLIKIRYLH